MLWEAIGVTDRGRRRHSNEDAYTVRPDLGLFVVADGMGGHAAGDVASAMAVGVVEEEVEAACAAAIERTSSCEVLREAVERAHERILGRAAAEPDKEGMGTTLTALAFLPRERAYRIAHVGDSRAYRLRNGGLDRLTDDHTWVQRQIDVGRLTPGEARTHPYASVLLRAVGVGRGDFEVDIIDGAARPGDLFLLCTDGLTGLLVDEDLRAIIAQSLPLETLAGQLIEAANLRGGLDNITAILIRVTE